MLPAGRSTCMNNQRSNVDAADRRDEGISTDTGKICLWSIMLAVSTVNITPRTNNAPKKDIDAVRPKFRAALSADRKSKRAFCWSSSGVRESCVFLFYINMRQQNVSWRRVNTEQEARRDAGEIATENGHTKKTFFVE